MTLDPLNLDFTDGVARAAFRRLLEEGAPIAREELAAVAGVDLPAVQEALTRLKNAGRAEFDGDQRLIGVFGLTLLPTAHRLTLRGRTYYVWCAFDAVGIPAALGESAVASSSCAGCGKGLEIVITAGVPPRLSCVVSWQSEACDSIREQFCPSINFFCDEAHFRSGPTQVAAGRFLTLDEAARLGQETWGWAAGEG